MVMVQSKHLAIIFCLYISGNFLTNALDEEDQDFQCETEEEHECVDATLCSTILKELLQTDNNLTHAQFQYCHHKEGYDQTKYGYGPIKGASGAPMACCNKYMVRRFNKKKVCSEKMPALRDEMCGRPSVFYLNLPIKIYLVTKDFEYKQRTWTGETLYGDDCFDYNRDNVNQRKKRCAGEQNSQGKRKRAVREEMLDGYIAHTGNRATRSFKDIALEKRRRKRFTGGKPARMGQFPFIATLYFTGVFEHKSYLGCLGTIIHKSIVLTTYNCLLKGIILDIWGGKFSVSNNSHEPQELQWINSVLYKVEPEPQQRVFKHALAPPEARVQAKHNGTLLSTHDIILIRLDDEFVFNDFVQPICLHVTPHSLERQFEKHGIAVGFGMYSEFKDKGRMRYAELEQYDIHACQKRYAEYYQREIDITTGRKEYLYFCYGGDGEESGPCAFDEGSPLIRVDVETGHMYQWGILLQQMPGACGLRDLPAIYNSLQVHYKWFETALPKVLQMQDGSYDEDDPQQCLTDNDKRVLGL